MSENIYIELSDKFTKIGELFGMLAKEVGKSPVPEASEPAEKPAKRGRPAKTETPAPEEPPVEDDKTVTADHPKRAELRAVAQKYAAATDKPTAQKAVKLFGESTAVVPDAELDGAIAHFKGLLAKRTKTEAPAEDI